MSSSDLTFYEREAMAGFDGSYSINVQSPRAHRPRGQPQGQGEPSTSRTFIANRPGTPLPRRTQQPSPSPLMNFYKFNHAGKKRARNNRHQPYPKANEVIHKV